MTDKLKVLDLFSGIGGFSLGLERTGGFETVAFCEIEEFPRKVLAKHWPEVPCFKDVRKLTRQDIEGPIDVICGGFPCQPVSNAGKRLGAKDDRFLWPEMLETVKIFKPTWFIAENVAGITSMEFERGEPVVESKRIDRHPTQDNYEIVLSFEERMLLDKICEQLEGEEYEVTPIIIPACAVDAKHRRDRIWIIAHSNNVLHTRGLDARGHSNSASGGQSGDNRKGETYNGQRLRTQSRSSSEVMAHAKGQSAGGLPKRTSAQVTRPKFGSQNVAYPAGKRQQGPWQYVEQMCAVENASRKANFPVSVSKPRIWPIEPNVGRVANGIPARLDRLKSLGNTVVPEIPEMIGHAILASMQEAS